MGCSCSYGPELEEASKFNCVRFKVLITGLKKVGKTSILQSAWWDNPEKLQTNSCLCYSKKVNIRGNNAFIDIWDSNLVSSTYFVDMSVVILVVDLSSAESLNVDNDKIKGFSQNIIVAGNKFDVSDGEIFRSAKLLAKQFSGFFVPISVINGFGVKDLWELVIYLISS